MLGLQDQCSEPLKRNRRAACHRPSGKCRCNAHMHKGSIQNIHCAPVHVQSLGPVDLRHRGSREGFAPGPYTRPSMHVCIVARRLHKVQRAETCNSSPVSRAEPECMRLQMKLYQHVKRLGRRGNMQRMLSDRPCTEQCANTSHPRREDHGSTNSFTVDTKIQLFPGGLRTFMPCPSHTYHWGRKQDWNDKRKALPPCAQPHDADW
jgi:hypothetical protein